MKKRAIVSVTSDLVTDQRVHRTCLTLVDCGYKVLLIGRKKRDSIPLSERPYSTHRMNLIFEKGIFFYAEYQLRLLFKLYFKRCDLLFSNDLDTLLPNYITSKLRRSKLIYDSHEYFTGVPELQDHPLKRKIWKLVERSVIPHLKLMITVNNSIAELYHREYGIEIKTVRNLPLKATLTIRVKTKEELRIPVNTSMLILQGAGINIHRGAEEAVESMQWVNNAVLYIIGGGDAISALKLMVQKLNLEQKVIFIAKLPFEELLQYTRCADIGLTLDKDTNLNYRYSLPNKLFDYIQAGVPVVASPLPEVKKIVQQYQIGECISSVTSQVIAAKLNELLTNTKQIRFYKLNALKARDELCWENECKRLEEAIRNI